MELACNAGIFWRAKTRASAFWSSERHLAFKLGKGLGRDKNACQGVGAERRSNGGGGKEGKRGLNNTQTKE